MYYVTTTDFKSFSKTKMLYDKGFNVIDASILPVGKKYVMFLKDETRNPPQKNIRVAFSKKLTSGFSAPLCPHHGQLLGRRTNRLIQRRPVDRLFRQIPRSQIRGRQFSRPDKLDRYLRSDQYTGRFAAWDDFSGK
jgi:hypothetical protein